MPLRYLTNASGPGRTGPAYTPFWHLDKATSRLPDCTGSGG